MPSQSWTLRLWIACAVLALIAAGSLAGKGGGGKPPKDDPPADPAIVVDVDRDLFVMDEDGSNADRLLRRVNATYVSWSPDGTRIAFACQEMSGTKLADGIYVVNVDSTGVNGVLAWPRPSHYLNGLAWSPGETVDGSERLAFTGSGPGSRDLFLVNLDGTDLINLTSGDGPSENKPSWSPDVDRIVVVQGQTYPNIVVHELGMVSGAPAIVSSTNLTASGPLAGEKVGNPKWAKTQDLIAVSRLGSTGDYEIWIIPVANPTAAYLAFDGEWAVPTSWSPDDTQILYRGGELKALTLSNGSTTTIYSPTGHLGGSDWRR